MLHRVHLLTFLLILVLEALLPAACFGSNTERRLSQWEDEELARYVTDAGIIIPDGIGMETIRGMLAELEEDPEHPAPVVDWTVISDLYENLRALLAEYEAGKK